jgi:1,4-alpha-glucan branching enzyme
MGTILIPGGVAFRVWAPFASAVFVAGTFNQWSVTDTPFASEGNGLWSVDVPGARIGDEYQFVIRNGGQPLIWHKNPYASEVANSSGNASSTTPALTGPTTTSVCRPGTSWSSTRCMWPPLTMTPGQGPGDLDLWRFDGWADAQHDGGIYIYDRQRAHTPWGDTRPDYGRGEVRQHQLRQLPVGLASGGPVACAF